MEVLISFCNQPESSKNNLLLLNIDSGKKEYLLETSDSFTGLAQDDDFFYALSQNLEVGLVVIDQITKKVVLSHRLKNLTDPHSIIINKDYIYAVSTGNDQILKYKFDKKNLSVKFMEMVWRPKGSRGDKDTHHVNSIFLYNNDIYISAFGSKKTDRWSSATNGYIYNITKNKKELGKIYHPHSVFIKNGDMYFCESSSRSVKKNYSELIKLNIGYTRGLYLKDSYLLLGTSSGRKRSKSTGLVNNFADSGIPEEDCRILLYKKKLFFGKYMLIKEYDFLPGHREIYDIIGLT